MKLRSLLMMMLAAFALTFAACDGADDGTKETPGGGDSAFALTVSDITASSATVSVVPLDATVTYYFDVVEKSAFDRYSDAQAFATDYIAALKEDIEQLELPLSDLLSQGNDSYSYAGTFTPSTEYYAFAAGVDADGTITTDVVTKAFATREVLPSDNTFTVTEDLGYITVTTSNNDPYVWEVYEAETFEGYSDDEIIETVLETLGEDLPYYTATGTDSYDYSSMLTNGVEYVVAVFGYDGGPTTGLTLYRFTYEGETGGSDTDLTGDVDFTAADECVAEYYGDYYESGTGYWHIRLSNEATHDSVSASCFSDLSAGENPTGTYVIADDTSTDVGTATGAYYWAGDIFAKLVEGTFNVTRYDDGNCTVAVDTKDSAGNRVTCNYSGFMTVYVYRDYMSLPSTGSFVPFRDRGSKIVSTMKPQRKPDSIKARDLRGRVVLR